MKFCSMRLASLIIYSLLLVSCGKEIQADRIVVRQGLAYEKGSKNPFSGYVVGKDAEDYRREKMSYRKQYRNGKLDGFTKYWYGNGQLESEEPYRGGMLEGVVKRYYENGQVKAKIGFKNGKRAGIRGENFWYEDGRRME